MNFIFCLLLFTHAVIHATGFSKAFDLREFDAIHKPVSHGQGILWAICTVLFVIAASAIMLNRKWWPLVALVAVIISQALIFINWTDARWASIVNMVILMVAFIYLADFNFQKRFRTESRELLKKEFVQHNKKVTVDAINHLPGPVQSWMMRSGVVGRQQARIVRLKQKGKMKTNPSGSWMPFHATQYITGSQPGYTWFTKVNWYPFLFLTGIDKLEDGKGIMQMKLLSIRNIASAGNNKEMNSGSMVRWLAEISWSPSMALNPLITWEEIDAHSSRAIINAGDDKVNGVFYFNSDGDVLKFMAQRYKINKGQSSLETWQVDMLDYNSFDGIRIPHRCSVSWKLAGGDFTWLELEITDIEYNNHELYKE